MTRRAWEADRGWGGRDGVTKTDEGGNVGALSGSHEAGMASGRVQLVAIPR